MDVVKNGKNQDLHEDMVRAVTTALTQHSMLIQDPEDLSVGTVQKWGRWLYGIAAILAVCFTAGWQAFSFSEEFVLHEELEPMETRITHVEQNLEDVSKGVGTLVEVNKSSAEYKAIHRKVLRRRQEYTEALQEYTADKAAGQRSTRPKKSPELNALEDELLQLESKLQTKEAMLLEN